MRYSFVGIVLISVAMGACSVRRSPPADVPAAPVSAADRDGAVLDMVLADMLAHVIDPTIATEDTGKPGFFFSAEPPPWPRTAETILMRHDKEQWGRLTGEQTQAAQEAAADVVRRNGARDGIKPFHPGDPRVVLWRKEDHGVDTRGLHAFAKRPVAAYPPGYTADGRFAVVALHVPWSMHSADATYLLRREPGSDRWVILLRQYVYYV